MGRDGTGRDGTEWNGTGWDGMRWDGMGRAGPLSDCVRTALICYRKHITTSVKCGCVGGKNAITAYHVIFQGCRMYAEVSTIRKENALENLLQ